MSFFSCYPLRKKLRFFFNLCCSHACITSEDELCVHMCVCTHNNYRHVCTHRLIYFTVTYLCPLRVSTSNIPVAMGLPSTQILLFKYHPPIKKETGFPKRKVWFSYQGRVRQYNLCYCGDIEESNKNKTHNAIFLLP